jgi:hypothetical protein
MRRPVPVYRPTSPERFRDNPVRHLVVEPDPQTGEMRPVTERGQPAYFYLSREEREL